MHALDLIGFAIILPTAIMFFMALEWGGQRYAWGSSVVVGLFVGAGLAFMLFLVWEYSQGDNAMLPFSMLRTRIVAAAAAYMFVFLGALFCFDYYLPIFFQSVEDDTPFLSGVHMLPQVIAQVVFAMVSGVMGMQTPLRAPVPKKKKGKTPQNTNRMLTQHRQSKAPATTYLGLRADQCSPQSVTDSFPASPHPHP